MQRLGQGEVGGPYTLLIRPSLVDQRADVDPSTVLAARSESSLLLLVPSATCSRCLCGPEQRFFRLFFIFYVFDAQDSGLLGVRP